MGISDRAFSIEVEVAAVHILDELVAESDVDHQARVEAIETALVGVEKTGVICRTVISGVPKPASFVGRNLLSDEHCTLESGHTAVKSTYGRVTVCAVSREVKVDVCKHTIHIVGDISVLAGVAGFEVKVAHTRGETES